MSIARIRWAFVCVGGLAGCGQQVSTTNGRSEMLDALDGASSKQPTESSAPESMDASAGSTLSCAELSATASSTYRALRAQSSQCEEDEDCTRQFDRPSGECWATCNPSFEYGSQAWEAKGIEAMTSAQEFCDQFRANDCEVLPPSCPPPSSDTSDVVVVCNGGQCVIERPSSTGKYLVSRSSRCDSSALILHQDSESPPPTQGSPP